jgi:hypothetical protein
MIRDGRMSKSRTFHCIFLVLLTVFGWAEELTRSVIDSRWNFGWTTSFAAPLNHTTPSLLDDFTTDLTSPLQAVLEDPDPTDDTDDSLPLEAWHTDVANLNRSRAFSTHPLCRNGFPLTQQQPRYLTVCRFLC